MASDRSATEYVGRKFRDELEAFNVGMLQGGISDVGAVGLLFGEVDGLAVFGSGFGAVAGLDRLDRMAAANDGGAALLENPACAFLTSGGFGFVVSAIPFFEDLAGRDLRVTTLKGVSCSLDDISKKAVRSSKLLDAFTFAGC